MSNNKLNLKKQFTLVWLIILICSNSIQGQDKGGYNVNESRVQVCFYGISSRKSKNEKRKIHWYQAIFNSTNVNSMSPSKDRNTPTCVSAPTNTYSDKKEQWIASKAFFIENYASVSLRANMSGPGEVLLVSNTNPLKEINDTYQKTMNGRRYNINYRAFALVPPKIISLSTLDQYSYRIDEDIKFNLSNYNCSFKKNIQIGIKDGLKELWYDTGINFTGTPSTFSLKIEDIPNFKKKWIEKDINFRIKTIIQEYPTYRYTITKNAKTSWRKLYGTPQVYSNGNIIACIDGAKGEIELKAKYKGLSSTYDKKTVSFSIQVKRVTDTSDSAYVNVNAKSINSATFTKFNHTNLAIPVEWYGKELQIRIKKTLKNDVVLYSEPIRGIYFLSEPNIDFSEETLPKCNGDEASFKIKFPDLPSGTKYLLGIAKYTEKEAFADKKYFPIDGTNRTFYFEEGVTLEDSLQTDMGNKPDTITINSTYINDKIDNCSFKITSGLYLFTVRLNTGNSASLCSKEHFVYIKPTPELSLTIDPVKVDGDYHTTKNNGTGSITLNPSGGLEGCAYRYRINGVGSFKAIPSGNRISGLKSGDKVYLSNANGCDPVYKGVSFKEPDVLNFSNTDFVKPTCNRSNSTSNTANYSNGSISYSAKGGIAPYKILLQIKKGSSWNNVATNNAKDGKFSGLTQGIYRLQLTDKYNNIKTTGDINLIPYFINTSIKETNPISLNCSNSTTTISLNNKPTEYNSLTYKKNTSSGFTTLTESTSKLGSGYYTVRLTKDQCYQDLSYQVNVPSPLKVTLDKDRKAICTQKNGELTYLVSGGLGNDFDYTVTLRKSNGDQVGDSQTITASNKSKKVTFKKLEVGTYYAQVTSNSSCSATSANYTLKSTNPLSVSVPSSNIVPVNCSGNSDGAVTLKPSGTASGYPISLSTTGKSFDSGTYRISNLAAQTYTFSISDTRGCSASVSNVRVGVRPDPVSISSVTSTDETCAEGDNGTIKVVATKGAGGYSYKLSNGASSLNGTFTGLNKGTYTVTVTDKAKCKATSVPKVVATASSHPITISPKSFKNYYCNNSKGQLKVNATHADTKRTLSWKLYKNLAEEKTGTFTSGELTYDNLTVGDYRVEVSDGACVKKFDQRINASSFSVLVDKEKEKLACTSANNGQVEVGIIDYTDSNAENKGFTYNFSGSTTIAPDDTSNPLSRLYTNLNNQAYSLTVKDYWGCEYTENNIKVGISSTAVTITTPNITPTSCLVATNGSIQISATQGIPDASGHYTFELYNATNTKIQTQVGTIITFSGLGVGNYTVKVLDSESCSAETSIIRITPYADISIANVKPIPPTCYGASNGSISFDVANDDYLGESYLYTLFKKNATGTYVLQKQYTSRTTSFTGLTTGMYTITIADSKGICSTTYSDIEVTQPTPIIVSDFSYKCVNRYGGNNGMFAITIAEGSKQYNYKWIKDGVELESSTLNYTGVSPVTFTKNNLQAGTYTFKLSDVEGCSYFSGSDTYEKTVVITQPAPLTFTADITHESCAGNKDGQVIISATGGWLCTEHTDCSNTAHSNCPNWQSGAGTACSTSPYLYALNGGGWQCSNTFSALEPGNYDLTVMDKAGITTQKTVTINPRPVMTLSLVSSFDATCPGYSNGRVVAALTNGVPSAGNFSYTLSCTDAASTFTDVAVANDANYSYNHLPKGNYQLSVSDLKGCKDNVTFNIGEPEPADITLTHNYIKDKGALTGEITINTQKGNGVFDHRIWLGGTSVYADTDNNTGEVSLNNLKAGTYQIEVRDTAGCLYETTEWMQRSVIIQEPAQSFHFAKQEQTNVSCKSLANGWVHAVASGGWGTNYTYSLNGQAAQTSGHYTNLAPGAYTVVISDTAGIQRNWDFNITEPDTLTMDVKDAFDASCPAYANGQIHATATNGIDFYNGLNYIIKNTDNPALIYGNTHSHSRNYIFNHLPKGNYEIAVTDSNACYASDFFTIDEPEVATINLTHNYIKAKGDATGEIKVQIEKGNGLFDYQWYYNGTEIAGQKGQTTGALALNNLLAGEYTLQVSDTARCLYETTAWMERTVEMKEPDKALRFNLLNNQPVSCFGLSNGKIEVEPQGGWGDYNFVVNAGTPQAIGIFNHLPAQPYHILLTDSTGVSWDSTIVVVQPELLTAAYQSHKDINCFGGNDGEIELDIKGGNLKYQVSLDETNWIEGNKISGLPIGNYNLYVRDTKNCTEHVPNIALNQPTEIRKLSENIIKSRCSNNEGEIISTFGGGVGKLNYQWYKISDDNTTETLIGGEVNATISNLYSSRYKVKVTDEHACTLPFTFVVGDITDLEIDTIKVTPVTCFSYSDGNAKAQVINGNSPYYYSWPSEIGQTKNDSAWGILSGEYELLVSDNKGCKTNKKFTIATPDPLAYDTLTLTHPLCYGGVQGNMLVQATGGTSGYSYTWTSGSNTNAINNVVPGTYGLTITDAHNCLATFNVDFDYQRVLKPFIGNDTLICNYDSLIIKSGAYSHYSLTSDKGYLSNLSAPVIRKPATYYLQVTDADNCLGFDTLSLDVSYISIADFKQTDVSCNKFADGNAQITVSPVGWNHVIHWPDGSANTTWNNLSGGNYTVEVTDDYGCVASKDFHIYEPDTLNYAVTDIQDPLCLGNFNGFINGTITGGVKPYTFIWNNGLSEESINKLDTGYYRIDVTDANNCFYQKEFNFDYRRTLTPFVGNDTLICHYNNLPLNAGNYNKFSWSSANSFSSRKQKIEITQPDTYYLKVTDTDNCLGFDTIKVDVSYLKIDNHSSTDVTCNADADGSAQIQVSPVDWKHQVQWSNGSNQYAIQGLSGGDYSVKVSDDYGCEDNQQFSIYEPQPLNVTLNQLMVPLCFGVPNGQIKVTAQGGRTPYSYEWLHGENDDKINKLDTGIYVLDIYDKLNCHIRKNYELRYETTIYPQLGEDKVVCQGNNIRLYPGKFEDYKWSNTLNNTATDTAWVVSDKAEYYVEVTDERNCVGRDTVQVDTRPTDLTPEFLMASSVPVGDTLMIIEVSQPKPQSFNWHFSGKHQIVEESGFFCKVIFQEEGNHEVILNAHSYNCMAQSRKSVLVTPEVDHEQNEDGTQQASRNIISFVASPNPNNGNFNAKLKLSEALNATYYLVRLENGQIIEKRKVNGLDTYNEDFNVNAPGVYAVFVEVGDERRVVKVLVN